VSEPNPSSYPSFSKCIGAPELCALYACLQRMIGLHRQLYEVCKMERQAFVDADSKRIIEHTQAKEWVIENIRQAESERLRISTRISLEWKRPLRNLTLSFIVREIEPNDAVGSERFRSALNALTLLIERARKLNESNREFVERSLEHVRQMKKNVLGEAAPQSETYGSQGQKVAATGGARLLSTEA
jgi:flagellar biosynthesis/type III secretory pathway chaperone